MSSRRADCEGQYTTAQHTLLRAGHNLRVVLVHHVESQVVHSV